MQGRIACWLYRALAGAEGVFWSSLDNGMASPRVAFFKKFRGIRPGLPDMVFIRDGRAHFIELKASVKTRPSKAQKQVFAALEAAGCRWSVCHSGAEVENTLRGWGFPLAHPFHDGYPIPDEWKSKPRKRADYEPRTASERASLGWHRRRSRLPDLAELQAAIAAEEARWRHELEERRDDCSEPLPSFEELAAVIAARPRTDQPTRPWAGPAASSPPRATVAPGTGKQDVMRRSPQSM